MPRQPIELLKNSMELQKKFEDLAVEAAVLLLLRRLHVGQEGCCAPQLQVVE
jgi:hypothetical protein